MTAGLAISPPPASAAEEKKPDAERDARIGWWREARFGMFIHWGLYAVPAGEWKGKPVAGIGEWIMNRAKIPVKDYEKFAGQFNPTKFDAEAWAQLAAGRRHEIPHHHLEASRRLCDVRQQGEPLQHRGCHPVQARSR